MKPLSRRMEALSRRMEPAVKRAQADIRAIVDRAIASGLAKPL
jgi:hypothetical protein